MGQRTGASIPPEEWLCLQSTSHGIEADVKYQKGGSAEVIQTLTHATVVPLLVSRNAYI
jgi:hypothetical protein